MQKNTTTQDDELPFRVFIKHLLLNIRKSSRSNVFSSHTSLKSAKTQLVLLYSCIITGGARVEIYISGVDPP